MKDTDLIETQIYPLPTNERDRLEELYEYDLLDTPPDEEFDRLTRFAEQELDVSVAAVTFIDKDRQFLKSASGTPPEDTPRNESFCTYTILSEDLTIIEDTRNDDRFDENYAVIDGQEVRSYSGAPLVTKKGNKLGSFCVYSFEPRQFQQNELELLELLRDQTMALIDSQHHEKQLRKLAHYDSTTGFLTRTRFMDQLQNMIDDASRSNQKIAIAHIDITRFSRVHESLGYEATDKILATVADRLNNQLPEQALKTRVLGDEFIVAIPGMNSRTEIHHLANTILSDIKDPISLMDESFLFSARIGISLFPETAEESKGLLRQANVALQEASVESSSSVQFYLEEMQLQSDNGQNLETDFLRTLENNEFTLNYQPKVSLEDRSVNGMEALIRWNHPEEGFIPPPTIITLAQTLGEMSNLGRWVMKQACKQVNDWNRNYDRDLDLGVNFSALEFQQGAAFIETIEDTLQSVGFPGDNLIVEVTETEAMDDLEFTIEILEELKAIPVQVAIDDFGTGRSSLKYLAEFPEPILKIDRAFVDGVTTNPSNRAIVQSTLDMAQSMGIKTIAEGVENKTEEDFLKDKGCDSYQGYYFSKPLDAESFEQRYLALDD